MLQTSPERHWSSLVQAPQVPVSTTQTGVLPVQSELWLAEHSLQLPARAPAVLQTGADAEQSALLSHAPQVWLVVLQMGVVPEQSELSSHWPQAPELVQTWPAAHWPSLEQAVQVWSAVLQTGVRGVSEQSAPVTQSTH